MSSALISSEGYSIVSISFGAEADEPFSAGLE